MIRSHASLLVRTACALLLWFSAAAVSSAQLATKQIDGRSYVSLDSIKSFYNFSKLTRSGNSFTLFRDGGFAKNPDGTVRKNKKGNPIRLDIDVKLRAGQRECLMNNVKFVFSFNVLESEGKGWMSQIDLMKLVDPVLRPTYIPNAGKFNTIILDPGHGGKDAGAVNSLGTEAQYNLDVATRLKSLLEKQGFRVLLTRDSNRYLTLQERVNLANRVNENAIFISIHFNAGGTARGLETFTLSPVGVAHYGRGVNEGDFITRQGNAQDSANVALATAVHGSVLNHLNEDKTYTLDRGIKRARFSVLTGVKHPAILFEGGFMSHPYEAKLIHTPGYRNAIAAGMLKGIVKYRSALNAGTVAKKP